jgi:ABC-type Mn2+/Zn2+ transport system permease subunit
MNPALVIRVTGAILVMAAFVFPMLLAADLMSKDAMLFSPAFRTAAIAVWCVFSGIWTALFLAVAFGKTAEKVDKP